jgi:protein-tyrosine kinase
MNMGPQRLTRVTDIAASVRSEVPIGNILINAGKLTSEEAERILALQREKNLRFGDAAMKLGLLTQADIDFALARQFDHPYFLHGSTRLSKRLVAVYEPFGAQVEALRAIRTQLMVRWFAGDAARRALAIVSPEAHDGRSFIAANLGILFSQLGERTLIIDADMRRPCHHELFGLDNRTGLSTAISGRSECTVQRVEGLRDLSVLTSGPEPPNPIELLSRGGFVHLLNELRESFSVILLDSPPASEYADAQVIAVRAGGALLVARRDRTRAWHAREIAATLARANSTVLGTVLNDFR